MGGGISCKSRISGAILAADGEEEGKNPSLFMHGRLYFGEQQRRRRTKRKIDDLFPTFKDVTVMGITCM